ncbi:hypothetical protein LZ32DRAFT_654126 [Colletotrichum eremochloae]|nr:hypothetical protein LZ32DRAFT_654126 [Colletotrichum eremochloae]
MLAKTFFIVAFAALAAAAPAKGGASDKQAQRVDELRKEGLTCNADREGIFVCDDGLGGNCFVNKAGSGTCL